MACHIDPGGRGAGDAANCGKRKFGLSSTFAHAIVLGRVRARDATFLKEYCRIHRAWSQCSNGMACLPIYSRPNEVAAIPFAKDAPRTIRIRLSGCAMRV
jgi:hypothetical protein